MWGYAVWFKKDKGHPMPVMGKLRPAGQMRPA